MTARRRLVPLTEVREALQFLREQGLSVGAVDIRSDGVTFYPESAAPLPAPAATGSPFDLWKAKDQDRDRPAPR